jgi:tRNA-(ms[2]io[6]A)-hydroxylase
VLCLVTATDPLWAERATNDLPTLLADHAHCEMKAASNALSLAARVPQLPKLARALIAIAKEELDHFDAVLAELERRGVPLPPPSVDKYAAELRGVTRKDSRASAEAALVDRLLIAALIEARSCERLGLVARALASRGEQELAVLYEELFASEARHYRTFLDLAITVVSDEAVVRERLAEMAAAEGAIAARLGSGATIHG